MNRDTGKNSVVARLAASVIWFTAVENALNPSTSGAIPLSHLVDWMDEAA